MKKRKSWMAAVLSLLCPGTGQLYNGDLRAAIVVLALGTALTAFSTLYLFDSLSKLLQAICLGLVLNVFFCAHAWWRAKQIGEAPLKPYQRWWVYLAYAAIAFGLPSGYGFFYPERFLSFQIPSESMVPTLLVGDRLIADGWAYSKNGPKRGDIVVFDYPRDHSIKFVKRVIGTPGDEVAVVGGELFVNKAHVYQERTSLPAAKIDGWERVEFVETLGDIKHRVHRIQPGGLLNFPTTKVPENSYFVMGDNRDRSSDSRVWGFVRRDEIVGQMKYIFFSWDSLAGSLRKERIGEEVH